MRKNTAFVAFVIATALTGVWVPRLPAGAMAPVVTLGAPTMVNRTPQPSHLRNQTPSPDFFTVCATRGHNSPACIRQTVEAIDNARAHEHMKKYPVILPNDYRKLSVAEQTFVITDLERVDRGLRPYAGLTQTLNHVSHAAAVLRVDPAIGFALMHKLGAGEYGSIWAEDVGPLASDYDWMYNDGYAGADGINVACKTPTASGCWGHRENILYPDKGFPMLTAGAGTGKPAGASIAEVLVGGYGSPPTFVYTWARALRHGANGHPIAARFRRTHG